MESAKHRRLVTAKTKTGSESEHVTGEDVGDKHAMHFKALGGLAPNDYAWDFIKLVTAPTTDEYTFRFGGAPKSAGAITAVFLITYTSTNKKTVDTVERTT